MCIKSDLINGKINPGDVIEKLLVNGAKPSDPFIKWILKLSSDIYHTDITIDKTMHIIKELI